MSKQQLQKYAQSLYKQNSGSVLASLIMSSFKSAQDLVKNQQKFAQDLQKKAKQPSTLYDMLKGDQQQIGIQRFSHICKQFDLGLIGRQVRQLFKNIAGQRTTISKRQFQAYLLNKE